MTTVISKKSSTSRKLDYEKFWNVVDYLNRLNGLKKKAEGNIISYHPIEDEADYKAMVQGRVCFDIENLTVEVLDDTDFDERIKSREEIKYLLNIKDDRKK